MKPDTLFNSRSTLPQRILFTLLCLLLTFSSYSQTNCDESAGDASGLMGSGGEDQDGAMDNWDDISFLIQLVGGSDPNDITGPAGITARKWMARNDRFGFTVRFENDAVLATAPAQKVIITIPVHPKFDIHSVRLGNFGFANMVFEVPPNSPTYTTRLNVIDSLGVYVDVTAGINVVTHEIIWIFQSIDPATGLPPQDALAGFLPVNDTTGIGQGEGFVLYSVLPATQAQTQDTTAAQASIVFDENAAILTNIETNTLDAGAPASRVEALPQHSGVNIPLAFSGTDDPGGCGLREFELFVNENNTGFASYRPGITTRTFSFPGVPGSHYAFFTLATDSVGNREALKSIPDAQTTVLPDSGGTSPVFTFQGVPVNLLSLGACPSDTVWVRLGVSATGETPVNTELTGSSIPGVQLINSGDSVIVKFAAPSVATSQDSLVLTACDGGNTCDSLKIQLTIHFLADLGISGDTALCAGEATELVASAGFSEYKWTPGDDATASKPVNAAGTYSVEVTDHNGCRQSRAVQVVVSPLPLVLASPDVTINAGQSAPLSATGAATYSWSPASGLSLTEGPHTIATPSETTAYVVTSRDANGCEGHDTVVVTVLPPSTLSISGLAVHYCAEAVPAAISGHPSGGTFTGPGISGTTFDPALAGAGTHVITYTKDGQSVSQNTRVVQFNPGSITSGDQTFCGSGDPGPIAPEINPTGSGGYQYRWYFKESATTECPAGGSTAGWSTNNTSQNISGTSPDGNGMTFDPISAGAVNRGRTFALFVTPIANGDVPACGVPQWAEGCRKTFVIPCTDFEPGVISASGETICHAGDPAAITLSVAATEGSAFQWYYKEGLGPAPAATAPLTGWVAIDGATAASFDPGPGLTGHRTYACRTTLSAISRWAAGVRQVKVLAPFHPGVVSDGDQTFCNAGNPGLVSLSQAPQGSGAYRWQWYYKESSAIACPTDGSTTAGWLTNNLSTIGGISIDGSGIGYDPQSAGTVNNGRTFAVLITPLASGSAPACGTPQWAEGCRKLTVLPCDGFNRGELASGTETICNEGDPATISFSLIPSNGSSFRWYYKNGIAEAPAATDPVTGWTQVSGATAYSYDPPAGLTTSRTYACRVTNAGTSQWAAGVRQVTVLPPFNPGSVVTEDQTFCNSGNPPVINLNQSPSGSGGYLYRWYFKESSGAECPSGSSTAGWSTNNTSQNISGTSFDGQGLAFDPISAGSVNRGRTFALFITPIANGNIPACGTPQWATGCKRTFVIPCEGFSAGVMAEGNQTICHSGDPANIYLSQAPTSGTTIRWYYRNGSVAAPAPDDPVGSWTLISGATSLNYNPPAGLTESRTYACRVTQGTNARWTQGARQVTVLTPFHPGFVSDGDQAFCNAGNPALVSLSQFPQGSGAYQWRWYYKESSGIDCPTDGSSTAGWLTNNLSTISGISTDGSGIGYDPQSAGTVSNGRTFAVLITPLASGSVPACGTPQWAESCRRLSVYPCRKDEETITLSGEMEIDPERPFLGQNFPNPSKGRFEVEYFLPETYEQTAIRLYDLAGKELAVIDCQAGRKNIAGLDISYLAAGTYYYSLESRGVKLETRKMVLIR